MIKKPKPYREVQDLATGSRLPSVHVPYEHNVQMFPAQVLPSLKPRRIFRASRHKTGTLELGILRTAAIVREAMS